MKRLTILMLAIFSVFGGVAHADLNDGLAAYYPFDGNARDESENFNDGTVHGATPTTDRFGNPDSAYEFKENDYIEVKSASSIEPKEALTISLWIKQTEKVDNYDVILTKRYSYAYSPYNSYILGFEQNKNNINFFVASHDSGLDYISDADEIIMNRWTHITGVYDGSHTKLYVNGELKSSLAETGNIVYSDLPLLIGCATPIYSDRQCFKGAIDDIRIYGRALDEAEIQELYQMDENVTPSCDSQNIDLCTSELDCNTAGAFWCDDVCRASPCPGPEPSCNSLHIGLCYDQPDCESAGGFWCDERCQVAQCPEPEPTCDSTNFTLCLDQASCESVGAFWCDNLCRSSACPEPVMDPEQPEPSSGIGKAIIIAAGGAHQQNTLFEYTRELCNQMYQALKARGYTDSDILYMNPVDWQDINGDGVEDSVVDYTLFSPENEMEEAFTKISRSLSEGDQFILYIHGHARQNYIKINNAYELAAAKLKTLLEKIPTGIQQTIMIDTCFSGSFLDDLKGVENRIVITSSDDKTEAWNVKYTNFSDKFIRTIRMGNNVKESFIAAEDMIKGDPDLFGEQRPQLDDDGDGFYSTADGSRALRVMIGKEGVSAAEPPIIKQIHAPIDIPEGQASATLWIKTSPSADGIQKARAFLIQPNYKVNDYEGEGTIFERIEIALFFNQALDRFEAAYDNFREAGKWRVMYQVQGSEGDWSDVKFGEVNSHGATPVVLDTWTNQTVYNYGEELSLGVSVNSRIKCDLYVLLFYPDGNFQTIYYPGHFSMTLEILPYREKIEPSPNLSIPVLSKTISQVFSPGLYLFGAIATYPGVDPLLADQWIHLAYDFFEVGQ